jgi:hypothetical protein
MNLVMNLRIQSAGGDRPNWLDRPTQRPREQP